MLKSFDKKKFLSQNSIWLVLIVLIIIMSIAQPSFFSVSNMLTLLSGEAVKGIMAFGVMFAILSKGIDLTIGASAALVAVITGSLVQPIDYANAILPGVGTLPAPLVFLIGLALGAGIGAIYGAIIAYTKIPPFIATLGAQLICRAGAKMYTNRPVSNLSEDFRFLGSAKIGNFPIIIIVFFVMFAIAAFLLTQTRFGKNVYAIGGNDQAARVAGINVEKNLILVYIWCSVCAAIAGMLLAGRAGSADPANTGLNYELDAIAACVIGGVSFVGGTGKISGIVLGVFLLRIIFVALNMLSISGNTQYIIKGLIILIACSIDMRKYLVKK